MTYYSITILCVLKYNICKLILKNSTLAILLPLTITSILTRIVLSKNTYF